MDVWHSLGSMEILIIDPVQLKFILGDGVRPGMSLNCPMG